MATLKMFLKSKPKSDGTHLCYIRVTHNRKTSLISTGLYIPKEELTKGLKIKNKFISAKVDDILSDYRKKLLKMDPETMTLEEVCDELKRSDSTFRLDFFQFAESKILKMKSGTQKSYSATLNYLRDVTGDKLPIDKLTRSVVDAMCTNLKESGLVRAPSLYMRCLKNLFKMACDEYNGEDIDSWKIRHNPFFNYKLPEERVAESRALSLDQVRVIIKMPYVTAGEIEMPGICNFAKDMFVLSLCLLGINSVDLYESAKILDNVIYYNREKTKDKRKDGAPMRVNIHPFIKPLCDKYMSVDSSFVFKTRYANAHNFNQNINKGLKTLQTSINKALAEKGLPTIDAPFTYYYARHTMATLAQNVIGINKYRIAELLNHSLEGSLKTTDRYTKKDWSNVFECNNKIVDILLDGSAYNPEEPKSVSGRSNTGYKGVYLYKGRYRAVYFFNGTNRNVGFFSTAEEAVAARNEFIEKMASE